MRSATRTIALPTRVFEQWDAIAVAQLCQRAVELDAENEDLQRRLRWAEQLCRVTHEQSTPWETDVTVEGVALQVQA